MVSTELNIYSSRQVVEIPFFVLNACVCVPRSYWVQFELRLLSVAEIYTLCMRLKSRFVGPIYVIVQFLHRH